MKGIDISMLSIRRRDIGVNSEGYVSTLRSGMKIQSRWYREYRQHVLFSIAGNDVWGIHKESM